MQSEDPFRIAVLIGFGGMLVIGVYHRLHAKTKERISRKDEGLLPGVSLRLAGLCVWAGAIAYLLNPQWMEWANLPLPSWLRWLGSVAGALGLALMYWTLTNLGKNLTDTVVTRSDATLVTTGPYRWVRHPFYVTAGLMVLAITLLAANCFIGLSGLLVVALLVARTGKEEQKLIEKFGDRYRAYMATTGRFVPKLKQS